MAIGRTHILILESDPAARARAAQRLRRNGFAVKAASSFADAVAYLERMAMPRRHAGTAAADGPKNPHAAALGRLGGRKGGETRAAVLSAKRRREIAQKAARARWGKHRAA